MNQGKAGKGEEGGAHLADFPVAAAGSGMPRGAWGWSGLMRSSLTRTKTQHHGLCLRCARQRRAHFLSRILDFFPVFHFAVRGRKKPVSVHKKPFGTGRKRGHVCAAAESKSPQKGGGKVRPVQKVNNPK